MIWSCQLHLPCSHLPMWKFTKPMDVKHILEEQLGHRLESRQDVYDYVDRVVNSYSREINVR